LGVRPFEHLIYPTAEDGGLGVNLTIDMTGSTGFSDFMLHFLSGNRDAGRINLIGIESPGLTTSLAIAEAVCHEIHNSYKNIFTISDIG
jgi:L-2-hydroxyglutarate oxidase LhgO